MYVLTVNNNLAEPKLALSFTCLQHWPCFIVETGCFVSDVSTYRGIFHATYERLKVQTNLFKQRKASCIPSMFTVPWAVVVVNIYGKQTRQETVIDDFPRIRPEWLRKMLLEAQGINWYIQDSNWKHTDQKRHVLQLMGTTHVVSFLLPCPAPVC
jgi:hypothetical protein